MTRPNPVFFDSCVHLVRVLLLLQFAVLGFFVPEHKLVRGDGGGVELFFPDDVLFLSGLRGFPLFPVLALDQV